MRTDGYSLIEVLVACSLAGALLLTAAPRLPALRASYQLQDVTFQVANDLRVARARAIATNGHSRIVFGSGSYQRRRESPIGSGTYIDDGAPETLPTGLTVISSPVNPTFDSRGLMTQAYTITVSNGTATTKTITLTAIGRVNVN